MLDRYYEEYLKRNPFEATLINDNRYNSLLPNDISESERAACVLSTRPGRIRSGNTTRLP